MCDVPTSLPRSLSRASWRQRQAKRTARPADRQQSDCSVSHITSWEISRRRLQIYRAYALAVKGLAGTRRGATERGLETIREALGAVRQHRVNVAYIMFTADFAEALAASGCAEEGLAVLEEGSRIIEQSSGTYGISEVLRVRGELTTEAASANASALQAFSQSLEWARRQGALAWELRAAVSLARLNQRHDARAAARDILAATYSRFTEGFETHDLRTARALLE